MDDWYSAEQVNAGFLQKLETEGPTKTAASSLNYIKDRLRKAIPAELEDYQILRTLGLERFLKR